VSEELLDARIEAGAHGEDEEYDTCGGDGGTSKLATLVEAMAILMRPWNVDRPPQILSTTPKELVYTFFCINDANHALHA